MARRPVPGDAREPGSASPVDVNAKIDELIEIVESARAMPMSASCVINRAQVLDLLDDLKRGLPEEMDKASKKKVHFRGPGKKAPA